MSTQFNCKKTFLFFTIQFIQTVYITIWFSVNTVSMYKKNPVLFKIIHFSISTLFKCNYGLIVKTFLFQAIQFNQTISV